MNDPMQPQTEGGSDWPRTPHPGPAGRGEAPRAPRKPRPRPSEDGFIGIEPRELQWD